MGSTAWGSGALLGVGLSHQLWALGSAGGLVTVLVVRLLFRAARALVLAVIAVAAAVFVLGGDHWQSIAHALQGR